MRLRWGTDGLDGWSSDPAPGEHCFHSALERSLTGHSPCSWPTPPNSPPPTSLPSTPHPACSCSGSRLFLDPPQSKHFFSKAKRTTCEGPEVVALHHPPSCPGSVLRHQALHESQLVPAAFMVLPAPALSRRVGITAATRAPGSAIRCF